MPMTRKQESSTPIVLIYPSCSTCRKAKKWLAQHEVGVTFRHIVEQPPTLDELTAWRVRTDQPISKMFNSSGRRYRELNLKTVVPTASESELLSILSSDPMLVKRPILVTDAVTCFGFVPDVWRPALKLP